MLGSTLVTLATFLLELSNCSPVYNMQPAFVTTHIGSFSGRNIRNLPCISRKNPSQTGVCMFAIDCLKSNGTHLGTCIDRFYFGSCCHIEPHVLENTIDTEVIDVREPPVRLHNTTSSLLGTTSTSKIPLSSSTDLSSSTKKPLVSTKRPISVTTHKPSSSTGNIPSVTKPQIIGSITKKPSRISTKAPPASSSTSMSSTQNVLVKVNTTTSSKPVLNTLATTSTERSTVLEKLQTFQSLDGTLIETTTSKSSFSTNNKKTVPTKPSTKVTSPVTTSKPVTNSTKPTKSTVKPTSKPTTSHKITNKPVKTSKPTISTKVTSKPTKPAKVTSVTSTSRPITISTGSTRRKPTKKPTKPSSTSGGVPINSTERTTIAPPKNITSTKGTNTKKPNISTSTTVSKKPTITNRPSSSPLTTSTTSQSTDKTTRPTTVLTTISSTKLPVVSETTLSKVNLTEVQETVVGNIDTNEIIESAASTTTTHKTPALVTWTFSDNKTTILGGNSGVVLTNITEEWVPLNPQESTPQDEWVLLPTATHQIPIKNETLSTANPLPNFSITTQMPSVDVIISEGPSFAENVSTSVESTITTSSSERPVLFTEEPLTPPVNDTSFIWFTTTSSQEPIVTTSTNGSSTSSTSMSPFVSAENATLSSNISSIANVTIASQVTESSNVILTEGLSSTTANVAEETEIKPVNMSDFTDVCGRRMYPGARIVGGEKSAYGRWPWQISLRQWRTSTYLHKCGAALLNENWAITAAHCVDNVPPNDLLLRLGEYDLSTDSEPYLHQERRVQIVASHPQFDPSTFEYDLALLRFYEPVTFQPNILPVCVPRDDENFVGKTAYVTGWGRLYEDGPLPSILQEVSVPVINNSVCETMYRSAGYIEHIPNIFICAGWRRGGFDSCEGDSGGPMVIQRNDKRFQLAGIISWGIGCAEPNQPGVYTRISEFRDWINQILQF